MGARSVHISEHISENTLTKSRFPWHYINVNVEYIMADHEKWLFTVGFGPPLCATRCITSVLVTVLLQQLSMPTHSATTCSP